MKKFKVITTILMTLFSMSLITCFCIGCDFVKYVEKSENQVVSPEVKLLQEEYVDRLYRITSEIKYRENEQKLYEYAIQDAVNELYECRSEAELKQVYEKHLLDISRIKTDDEYSTEEETAALSAYRVAVLGQAEESYDKQKYTEEQNTYFDSVLAAFSSEIFETTDTEKMNELLQKFYFDIHKEDEILSLINYVDILAYEDSQQKILSDTLDKCIEYIRSFDKQENIDEVKQVYKFEVYKRNTVKKLNEYVDLQLYRNEQVAKIKEILSKHLKFVEETETKIEADNVFREYQIAVYDIPTDAMLYSEELAELKIELNSSLLDSYKLSFYRESEGQTIQKLLKSFQDLLKTLQRKEDVLSQYVILKNKLDLVKTAKVLDEEDRLNLIEYLYIDLQNRIEKNIEGVDKDAFLLKAEKAYADMQDRISLESVRAVHRVLANEISAKFGAALDILKEELIEYKDTVYYREKEQNEVNIIKEEYILKFIDEISLDEAKALLQTAKAAIDKIKTNDDLWNDSVTKFRSDLKSLYGEAILEEPKSLTEANDYYELADIVDYYAFYQLSGTEFVCDTFRVKLNFNHNDAESEINNFYWQCELLRSGVGINGWIENNNFLVLKLISYELASTSNVTSTDKIKSYSSLVKFESDTANKYRREKDFNNYPYMKLSRSVYGIWNSQQIWYALEHNYKPICLSGSPAETVFNKAKSILCEIILEGMSVEEKIFQIYSWFAQNVQYDHQYTNDFYQSVLEKYPEAALSRAFHAEGALIDELAVCEGYAKAYLILLRIEGIESYRIVQSQSLRGHIVSNHNEKVFFVGYKSHAFVAIKMPNGQVYYSDPENSFVTAAEYLQQFQQCLIPSSLYDGYSGIIYFNPAIEFATNLSDFYYNLYLDDKKLFIGNKDELREVIDTLMIKMSSLENVQVSIFCDVKKYINFQNDIIELLNGLEFMKKSSSNNITEFTEIIVFK